MKSQTLLSEKRRTKNRISTTMLNEMNVGFRRMKTCGLSTEEFCDIFSGDSFFEYVDRNRKLQDLRRRINK